MDLEITWIYLAIVLIMTFFNVRLNTQKMWKAFFVKLVQEEGFLGEFSGSVGKSQGFGILWG